MELTDLYQKLIKMLTKVVSNFTTSRDYNFRKFIKAINLYVD